METQIEKLDLDEDTDLVENIVESDLLSLGEPDEDLSESSASDLEESKAKKVVAEEDDAETADAEKGDSGKNKDATADGPVPNPLPDIDPDSVTAESVEADEEGDQLEEARKSAKKESAAKSKLKKETEDEVSKDDIDGKDDDGESDDGDGLDAVGDEDDDIDNDGDSDAADEYLLALRKKRAEVISKQDADDEEEEEKEESKTTKKESKAKVKKESTINFDNIKRLVEQEEGLTDEFRGRAALIFETELLTQIEAEKTRLAEEYEVKLEEQKETVKETLTNQVDSYITYVAEEWMEENKVAVESSLRSELSESFISALKDLFVEHYIEVPESKVDLYAKLEAETAEIKETLEKAQYTNDILSEKLVELSREKVINEASHGLSEVERAKLEKLTEGVEYEDDQQFAEKVDTLKEFYFNGSDSDDILTEEVEEDSSSYIETETIIEEGVKPEPELPKSMKNYLSAISRQGRIASQQGGL